MRFSVGLMCGCFWFFVFVWVFWCGLLVVCVFGVFCCWGVFGVGCCVWFFCVLVVC